MDLVSTCKFCRFDVHLDLSNLIVSGLLIQPVRRHWVRSPKHRYSESLDIQLDMGLFPCTGSFGGNKGTAPEVSNSPLRKLENCSKALSVGSEESDG